MTQYNCPHFFVKIIISINITIVKIILLRCTAIINFRFLIINIIDKNSYLIRFYPVTTIKIFSIFINSTWKMSNSVLSNNIIFIKRGLSL